MGRFQFLHACGSHRYVAMSRLSFRPRPLDIHKKLPIVKSIKDLDFEDSNVGRAAHSSNDVECENLVLTPAKKAGTGSEIPTPQFLVVDSYEKDYTQSFVQPPSYIRGRPARNENTEFCEYDLDNDDEIWLLQFNNDRKILQPEKFEMMLYKLEIMDHKTAERQGSLVPVLGAPIPIVLTKDVAIEVLKQVINRPTVLGAVYDYWRIKREKWQKPILRRLQPPPPVNDTNPFNVFRPREKIHRPHTRRMQRRENDLQSFEKLRQVRLNIERSLLLIRAVQQREERKREIVEVEANAQRLQLRLKADQFAQHDALRAEDDGGGLPSSKFGRAEDGHRFMSRGDHVNGVKFGRSVSTLELNLSPYDGVAANEHQEIRRPRRRPRFPPPRYQMKEKMKNLDPMEPAFLFTKPLDSGKLAAAGIGFRENDPKFSSFRLSARIGRGGRIVYDRWNPFIGSPFDSHNHSHSHISSLSIGAPVNRFGARPFRRVADPLAHTDTIPSAVHFGPAPPSTSATPL